MTSQSLSRAEFPKSSRYEADWMLDGQMGPNALWLLEYLCEAMPLSPGMRILDLGCGRAMTSVFLAREYEARVCAVDLWIEPDDNWKRVAAAGCANSVLPVRAEAHALPFAADYFDAIVSIDAYQYFGTDDLYLNYLSRFVRPGGAIGIVVPGLTAPFDSGIPAHLREPQANGKVFWEDECRTFKTATFWRELWAHNASVTEVRADTQPDGWRHWRDFEAALERSGKGLFPSDAEALDRDQGRFIGFHRLVARRSEREAMNLYDSGLGLRVGVR